MYDVAFHLSVVATILSHFIAARHNPRPSATKTKTTTSHNHQPILSKSPSLPKPSAHLDKPANTTTASTTSTTTSTTTTTTKALNISSSSSTASPVNSTSTLTNARQNCQSSVLSSKLSSPSLLPLSVPSTKSFQQFQNNYLLIYLLAVSADWVQGPYVYALYSHYGFSNSSIARLYIAGFASSAVFGTVVASIADKYGRRRNALFYCLTYILSCITKHSPNFYILLLGRILGGIAYSILFSAFESWMVYEHRARSFDTTRLASTFAVAQFGNGIVAIVAGLIAGYMASNFGKVAPFDLSIFILLTLTLLISKTWSENYGDSTQSVSGGFGRALKTLLSDKKIVLLGVAQAAFEGALYVFTFVWTPALQHGNNLEIPHGTVFSTFMACTMIGSNIFSICCTSKQWRVEFVMKTVFFIGFLVFSITVLFYQHANIVFIAFLIFEILCGVYFPGMATARAPYIPEESRSALLTFFRVPLNVIVVVALSEDLPVRSVFALCAMLMAIATASMYWLIALANKSPTLMKNTVKQQQEHVNDICMRNEEEKEEQTKLFGMNGYGDHHHPKQENGRVSTTTGVTDENC